MKDNLVIVESPAKAKTIEKFLGEDYKVVSSYGHIRDLKKRTFSVDVNTFAPQYEVPSDKKSVVENLKKLSKEAKTVWLASDEDREGEAISWHLYEVLGLRPENTRRIVFHEITKPAILEAIENPRKIDLNLVNAQQARRVLDRIVGFKLSPVLWRKVKPALSAGRVQSVAVRLIVEREREIQNFSGEDNFRVTAVFTNAEGSEVKAELNQRFATQEQAEAFLQKCSAVNYTVQDISTKPQKRVPAPPFTTSTLQQEAAHKLGFTVAQTMMVAQHLYESGRITYMRTDSVNLSKLCLGASKQVIAEQMGKEYVKTRQYQTSSKGAQEAHEAIRPTYMEQPQIEGTQQERRLYDLIWKRTIASQMADAEIEKTQVVINIDGMDEYFVANGEVVKFDGFLRVYKETENEVEQPDGEAEPIDEHFGSVGVRRVFKRALPRQTAHGVFPVRNHRVFLGHTAEIRRRDGVNICGRKDHDPGTLELFRNKRRKRGVHTPGFPFMPFGAELSSRHVDHVFHFRERVQFFPLLQIGANDLNAVLFQRRDRFRGAEPGNRDHALGNACLADRLCGKNTERRSHLSAGTQNHNIPFYFSDVVHQCFGRGRQQLFQSVFIQYHFKYPFRLSLFFSFEKTRGSPLRGNRRSRAGL